jgi:glycosyltransferase involved in cell wall biosynthesis
MMRSGDKLNSYEHLASALVRLQDKPWTLSVVGDGPMQTQVKALFANITGSRISWLGRLETGELAKLFARCSLYVWPGCGEAYGLAYLEAQAAGLPVVAYETAGVPEVVQHGVSGVLTPAGDIKAYAQAIDHLLQDPDKLLSMSVNVRNHVQLNHSEQIADKQMMGILKSCFNQSS